VDYFEYAVVDGNHPHYCTWQSNLLRWRKGDEEALNFDDLKQRIRLDELYMFPTAGFDTSCILLQRLHPELFSGTWYKRKNVSKKDQKIPDGLRERFSAYSTEDYELLELARAQTDRLISKVFIDESDQKNALAAFHARNRWKSRIDLPRAGFRRLLMKTLEVI
jgi:hypothetical protein